MKIWLLIASLLLIAFLLYPRHEILLKPGMPQRQEIVYWTTGAANDANKAAIAEFERKNPQYSVTMGTASVRDATGDPSRFLLSVAGGSPPDVMSFDRFAVVEWAARGAFLDLKPFLEADRHAPDAIIQDRFYAPMFDEPRYQGHQYAIPDGVDLRALFVNDDLLIRAGLTNQDGTVRPPKSWEDICRKKFQGAAVVNGDTVRLGQPDTMPGVGPLPVSGGAPQSNDVIALRSGTHLFRARIASVDSDGAIHIDYSRELPPDIRAIPEDIAHDPALEAKVFDGQSYAIAMTHYDDRGDITVIGFSPLDGNSWLYMYGWQNGATFLSDDGRHSELDQPQVKVALQFMVDCYDALGGYQRIRAYEDAQKGSPLHPFLTGKIAMRIDGDWFLNTITQYKSDLRYTVTPAPIPENRLKAGFKPITWAGGFSYAIPTGAKNPTGAWALMRFLSSQRAGELTDDISAAQARARGAAYIPRLSVLKSLAVWRRHEFLEHNAAISPRTLAAYDTFVALLPESKFRPITPVGSKLWEGQRSAAEDALSYQKSIYDALTSQNRWVQENLDRYLHPLTGPLINWNMVITGYIALLFLGAAILTWSELRWRKATGSKRPWIAGYICVSPWLMGFIIFGGGPILFSMIISLCRYDVLNPAQFVGLRNYTQLLGFHQDPFTGHTVANDADLWKSLANTGFMVVGVPLGIILGLLMASLLAQELKGISIFRTIFYLPSIVPAIASFLLWLWIFDPSRGLLNQTLRQVGIDHPPAWLSDAAWSKPALIIMGLWGVGGGMLIWLAGLKNIPTQLYEAAEIDGAGLLRRFFHITLPMLSPYIFFNTVMGLIGSLQVFEAAFIMTDGGPQKSTMFYAYYLFNQAFRYLDMGAASAMAWILFVIVISLTLLQLWIGKKWVHYE